MPFTQGAQNRASPENSCMGAHTHSKNAHAHTLTPTHTHTHSEAAMHPFQQIAMHPLQQIQQSRCFKHLHEEPVRVLEEES